MSRKPVTDKYPVYYVRWFDSAIYTGRVEVDDLDGPVEEESAGFLVKEDDQSITLALCRGMDNDTLRLILCIPRVNVRVMSLLTG